MIPTITYDHTRVRTTEFVYDVTLNGDIVAAANTWHAGEVVGLEVEARDELLTMAASFAEEGRESYIGADLRKLFAPQDYDPADDDAIQCPICGSPAHCDCDPRPLLAQCAALLDNLLGGPVIGGGVLDELRRVRAALRNEGW
mgnify:CR=1